MRDSAKDYIVEHGYDPVFGARPLKRLIQREVETRIARIMIERDIAPGSTLVVESGDDGLTVEVKA